MKLKIVIRPFKYFFYKHWYTLDRKGMGIEYIRTIDLGAITVLIMRKAK